MGVLLWSIDRLSMYCNLGTLGLHSQQCNCMLHMYAVLQELFRSSSLLPEIEALDPQCLAAACRAAFERYHKLLSDNGTQFSVGDAGRLPISSYYCLLSFLSYTDSDYNKQMSSV